MGEMIKITSDEVIDAYLATPSGPVKGAIIVIHEVWALVDHIKAIADRFAGAGYTALASNLLSDVEFKTGEISQLQQDLFKPETKSLVQPRLRELMSPTREPEFAAKTIRSLKACFDYLYEIPEVNQKVAVIGFCFGGTYSFSLAVSEPRLKLALPFYGHADQSVEELSKINCQVKAFYGQNDENLISALPDLSNRMMQAKVNFESKVYEGCGHAFFNDTNPITYNKLAADDAWDRVLEALTNTL